MNKRIHLSPPNYDQEVIFPEYRHDSVYDNIKRDIVNFEINIKRYLDTDKEVLALNSGTAALHLALILAGVKKGDYVLCQSMTFVACANPILYLGATPVFVDSEPGTWNICPKTLETAYKATCEKGNIPKAIIVTSLYGMPCEMDVISAFAKANNLKVIEDSAEALGASYKGQQLSTIGDYGVLSFNLNKIITTAGGGMLILNSKQEKEYALYLATQAKENLPYYQHEVLGYNYRLGHLNAALGNIQLKSLNKNLKRRLKNHQFYKNVFQNIEGVILHKEPKDGFLSNHWLSAILVDPSQTGGITREDIRLAFEKDNIESRPLWKPMHMQPLYKQYPYYGGTVCEELFENGLCLPSGSNLTNHDRERIQKSIKNLFR